MLMCGRVTVLIVLMRCILYVWSVKREVRIGIVEAIYYQPQEHVRAYCLEVRNNNDTRGSDCREMKPSGRHIRRVLVKSRADVAIASAAKGV